MKRRQLISLKIAAMLFGIDFFAHSVLTFSYNFRKTVLSCSEQIEDMVK